MVNCERQHQIWIKSICQTSKFAEVFKSAHAQSNAYTFTQSHPCFEQFLRGCPFSWCWCGSCILGRHDTLRQGLSSRRPRSMQSMLVRWMHCHYKISQSNAGRFACNCHSAALLGRAHASLWGRRDLFVPLHRRFCLLNVNYLRNIWK